MVQHEQFEPAVAGVWKNNVECHSGKVGSAEVFKVAEDVVGVQLPKNDLRTNFPSRQVARHSPMDTPSNGPVCWENLKMEAVVVLHWSLGLSCPT